MGIQKKLKNFLNLLFFVHGLSQSVRYTNAIKQNKFRTRQVQKKCLRSRDRTVLSAGKERSRPIAKRKRFKTRKAAKEAAERANKTKDPIVVHPAGGKSKQPHYQPK